MKIQLSDHFSLGRLMRFTIPSIIMMVFTSVYGVVDGFFVSNLVGKTPFAAVNFIWPFLMILGAVGFMFGAGGGALIAKTLGEGKHEKAQRLFSMFVYVTAGCGIGIGILGMLLIRPVARLLGAEGIMLENCVIYGRIILSALPLFMLQYEFQTFFITAQKPRLGLAVTVVSGIANMVMDYLFMAVFRWGLPGAAMATALSQSLGGLIPLVYFSRPNGSLFRLGKASLDKRALAKACINGSSELMSNISMSLVGMLYNLQLLKYAGEDGVAAYGVLMYVNMVFLSIFIGYSTGVAPVVGFHFGAGNRSGASQPVKEKLCGDLSFLRGHVRGGGASGKAAGTAFCGIRPRAHGADGQGIPDLLIFIPVFRDRHFRLCFLYSLKRWAYFGGHCFFKEPGV